MRLRLFGLIAALGGSALVPAGAQAPASGIEVVASAQLRAQLGLARFEGRTPKGLSQIKIAVLDRGFFDLRAADLPANARLETFGALQPPSAALDTTAHGAAMARTIWAVTGQSPHGPQFYLLNANGLTNFRRAIDFVIQEKISIVLHAHNWEFGGNFDGKGFINAEVSRATRAGVLWIAAAGGYGGKVRQGRLAPNFSESPCFPFENRFDRNAVRITLAWNDFRDTEAYATSKDLALSLYSWGESSADRNLLSAADRKQSGVIPEAADQLVASAHAREVLEQELPKGKYCVRVQARSAEWTEQDRYRIALASTRLGADSLVWSDLPKEIPAKETPGEIMVPGDHAEVLTVGERSEYSARGPTVDGRTKPEVSLSFSEIRFSDGTVSAGTSNAAAMFAGWAAVQIAATGGATTTRDAILALVGKQRPDWVPFPSSTQLTVPDARMAPLVDHVIAHCGLAPEQILSVGERNGRATVWVSRGASQASAQRPHCLSQLPNDEGATLSLRTFARFSSQNGFQLRRTASPGRVVFDDERWGGQSWVELVVLP